MRARFWEPRLGVVLAPSEARQRELGVFALGAVGRRRLGGDLEHARDARDVERQGGQTASTRPSPYFSQRRRSAYVARILAQGKGPPGRRSA